MLGYITLTLIMFHLRVKGPVEHRRCRCASQARGGHARASLKDSALARADVLRRWKTPRRPILHGSATRRCGSEARCLPGRGDRASGGGALPASPRRRRRRPFRRTRPVSASTSPGRAGRGRRWRCCSRRSSRSSDSGQPAAQDLEQDGALGAMGGFVEGLEARDQSGDRRSSRPRPLPLAGFQRRVDPRQRVAHPRVFGRRRMAHAHSDANISAPFSTVASPGSRGKFIHPC